MTTVFSRIIKGELPCEKVFENEKILAIKDIQPHAPVHILIIPKAVYKDLQSIPESELGIVAEVVKTAQLLAKEFQIEEGYRLLTNNGSDAGQTVFHLHFHLLGGRTLGGMG